MSGGLEGLRGWEMLKSPFRGAWDRKKSTRASTSSSSDAAGPPPETPPSPRRRGGNEQRARALSSMLTDRE